VNSSFAAAKSGWLIAGGRVTTSILPPGRSSAASPAFAAPDPQPPPDAHEHPIGEGTAFCPVDAAKNHDMAG
jgi:hypothetical protein